MISAKKNRAGKQFQINATILFDSMRIDFVGSNRNTPGTYIGRNQLARDERYQWVSNHRHAFPLRILITKSDERRRGSESSIMKLVVRFALDKKVWVSSSRAWAWGFQEEPFGTITTSYPGAWPPDGSTCPRATGPWYLVPTLRLVPQPKNPSGYLIVFFVS